MTKQEQRDLLERYKARSREINKATIESIIQESPEAQEARIKHFLKPENYGAMFNYYFGKDTPIPLAENDCAWYHIDIYKELYYKQFITIFNLIFRGGAKSTHANLGYPFALKQSEMARFFLVVGANEVLAAMLLQDLQVQFECNNRIIKDFGMQKSYGDWKDGQFETTDRCNFMASGIDQKFRGLKQNGVRVEYASIDDVEDKKRALNPRLISEYAGKITGDIQGAFSPNSERTIINNNYFVEKGFIEELAKKKGIDLKGISTKKTTVLHKEFTSLYLVNMTDKYYEQVKENNMNTWKPEWEDRFPRAACLRKIKQYEDDKETLSGEYYNTPINVGKRIKESMIHMVEPYPLNEYELIAGNWDLSYTDSACYKANATGGVKNMQIIIEDVFCRQTDLDVVMEYHFRKTNEIIKENSSLMSFYDASVAQEAIFEKEWIKAAKKYKCFYLPEPQRSGMEKYLKIDTVLPTALKNRVIVFSNKLKHNPDWPEAKRQMLRFEKGGNYAIDFPDALTDLLIQLQELVGLAEILDNESPDSKPIITIRKRGGY